MDGWNGWSSKYFDSKLRSQYVHRSSKRNAVFLSVIMVIKKGREFFFSFRFRNFSFDCITGRVSVNTRYPNVVDDSLELIIDVRQIFLPSFLFRTLLSPPPPPLLSWIFNISIDRGNERRKGEGRKIGKDGKRKDYLNILVASKFPRIISSRRERE